MIAAPTGRSVDMTAMVPHLTAPDTALDVLAGLRDRLPRVVDAAVAAYHETTVHRASSRLHRAGADGVRWAVQRQFDLALADSPWTPDDLDRLAVSMRLSGRARVPHGDLLRTRQHVQLATHRAWWQVAEPPETAGLMALSAWSRCHTGALLMTFDSAYRDGLASAGNAGERRSATCRALLDGRAASVAPPEQALPPLCTVLVVVCGDAAGARAAHRVLERDDAALACAADDTVSVLLPRPSVDDGDLLVLLGKLADVRRVAVVEAVPVDTLPDGHAAAVELAGLAAAADEPRVVVRAADLELDSQAARCRFSGLDRLLDRLDADLVQTLDQLYRCDLDRTRTAAALFVHRNTVDYRLRRITALTGVSPVAVRGIQIFATALTRHRLRRV